MDSAMVFHFLFRKVLFWIKDEISLLNPYHGLIYPFFHILSDLLKSTIPSFLCVCVCVCIYIYVCVCVCVSWLTMVESNLKAPFSIATTPRCREGHYSFLWIAPITHDPYVIIPSVKQKSIKYYFLSLWYDSTWDLTKSPRSLGNTLTIMPVIYIYIYIYMHIANRVVNFWPMQYLRTHT